MPKLLNKFTHWYFSKAALPYWYVLAIDCLAVMFSGYLGQYFAIGGNGFASHFWPMTAGLAVCVAIFCIFFRIFHTYSGIIRYSSFVDLERIIIADVLSAFSVYLLSLAMSFVPNPPFLLPEGFAIIILCAFSCLLMCGVRVAVKNFFETIKIDDGTQRVFIYGDKEGAVAIAKAINSQTPAQFSLAGFISPDETPAALYLMGQRVLKDDSMLVDNIISAKGKVVLVSPLLSEHFREREELVNALTSKGIRIMMMPKAEEWDGKSEIRHDQLREVEIEDLLPREKIEINMDVISEQLKYKSILITGAAGSIGSEIVRQAAKFHPENLILVDQAETPMHDLRLYMQRNYPYIKCETIVATITNQEYMEGIFAKYKPQYVFHAAAYKHVPMMEDNPVIAVENNVWGTRVIADLAVKYGTQKFVMISTDKAVNPTNVMGCSKRICEIYCQSLNKAIQDGTVKGVTQFVTTRFGNVLGSNGSVIPIFKEQIKRGGPVTVTDPSIIRYFMLIPEACKLVLEAGTIGNGGEIFVFDMGKPVKIVNLAKRMISLSGAQNIEIKFTGLRDGEKLYEEVLSDKESTKPTTNPKIMIASVREYDYQTALSNEERLMAAARSGKKMAVVKVMKEIVPEYKSRNSIYEELD